MEPWKGASPAVARSAIGADCHGTYGPGYPKSTVTAGRVGRGGVTAACHCASAAEETSTMTAVISARMRMWFGLRASYFIATQYRAAGRRSLFRILENLWRELAAEVALHLAAHGFRRVAAAEEVIQLRQRRLGGHVAPADDAGARQRGAGGVLAEVDGPFEALRAVDDDDAARGGLFERGEEGAVVIGAVADAVGLEHEALQRRGGGGGRGGGRERGGR